jgi:nicotinamidase-related amidase
MKKLFLLIAVLMGLFANAQNNNSDTALLIIDVQYFYYPGGKAELVNPKPAGENAGKLLAAFRSKGETVIHVRHNFEPGGKIHDDVKPIEGEKVISKDYANSFRETDLQEYLKEKNIGTLIICGMQTHMCVEAATRAASDLNYNCIVVQDACATRNLKFGDKEIKAEDVHYSTLSSLTGYAKIMNTADFLKSFD